MSATAAAFAIRAGSSISGRSFTLLSATALMPIEALARA
jgi:hypothetical protein